MSLEPGLGTGSCQGHVFVPCHNKTGSQASLALGWKCWPRGGCGLALSWAVFALLFSRSAISPVYFILRGFFGSSTIGKAQRGRRVFLVLDRIIFWLAFSRKPSFLGKKPQHSAHPLSLL